MTNDRMVFTVRSPGLSNARHRPIHLQNVFFQLSELRKEKQSTYRRTRRIDDGISEGRLTRAEGNDTANWIRGR